MYGVALYESEIGIIGIPEKRNIEALKMWCDGKTLKIKCLDKICDE